MYLKNGVQEFVKKEGKISYFSLFFLRFETFLNRFEAFLRRFEAF
jgi:hypothetical protein